MVLAGYGYRFIQNYNHAKDLRPHIKTIIYRFDNKSSKTYIVKVEHYINEVYVIKFYLQSCKASKWKFHHLTHEFDARKVLFTCINISLDIFSKNPNASFGFIGCPIKKELKLNGLKNTKRFRVYEKLALTFFNPDTFVHAQNSNNSTYLLVNKKETDYKPNLIKDIQKMFNENYDISAEMFLNPN